jgi:superfamily I DNA/RNA helicase
MNQGHIPFSIISTPEDGQKVKYSDTSGVVLSSIDSSLGLDFRAVVLAGLYPFNYVFDSNSNAKKLSSWEIVGDFEPDVKENVQIEMRKLYTACSRAREVLYVLSDLTPGTIIDDIIRNGEKR